MNLLKNLAISDTGFVFNPATGDSFSVNPIGLDILKHLKDGKSENEIRKHLLESYQTDKETVEKDLYDFFKMLDQLRLTEHD
ncbi:MAG: PqqD family protein [Bacteroidota bacterium]|jgi:PqqD family protein of HPr-rel-A system|nr:PqqD family protein [Sphingobacteriales bacterium]